MGRLVECNACGHWQVSRSDFPECECCGCHALTPVLERIELPAVLNKCRYYYTNHGYNNHVSC